MNEETVRTLSKVLSRNAEIYAENIRSKISKLRSMRSDCMSEWLTTGEMIDKLKVGEIAEHHIGDFTYRVRKESSGSIICLDVEGEATGHYLKLEGGIVKGKWRILPNYVSFEEAMSARKNDGKQVYFIDPADGSQLELKGTDPLSYFGRFSWEELFNGNWLIENA